MVLIGGALHQRLHALQALERIAVIDPRDPHEIERRGRVIDLIREIVEDFLVNLDGVVALVRLLQRVAAHEQGIGKLR